MVIKILLWLNQTIETGVNTEIKSRYLCINENGLHHSFTENMENKDPSLFISSSTIKHFCNAIASRYYVSVLLVLLIADKVLLPHSYSK